AQLISGAERVGWIERYSVTDPALNGLWALAVGLNDDSADIVWRHKINDSPNSGPSGTGWSMPLPPLAVNPGNYMKWLDGATVWTVDFRLQESYFYSTGNQITNYRTHSHQMYWPSRGAILIFINDPTDEGE